MAKFCPRCAELLPDDAVFCPFDGTALEPHTDKFLGKTIAARYRLVKKLGAGGMSLVYLARHELIARLSALKIMRPELSQVPEHRERFLREARAVNRINHENIVEITDVGESDGVAYLVMEYVEGDSLLSQIQHGPLRWERAVRIAVQVASALARTHQMGVIHRDLKPENILLVQRKAPVGLESVEDPTRDVGERVKLTDFGIAKMAGEATLTLNEQLFGTPGYIAPEYVSGLPIDGRADIYSLGVVLYEMVTGELPFEGKGQSDLLLKPLTTNPIHPSKRVKGLPPALEDLLMKCLLRDPAARHQDAFALHDALIAILQSGAKRGEIPPMPETQDEIPLQNPRKRGRDASATVMDLESSPELQVARETAELGKMLTNQSGNRWSDALAELERAVATAQQDGGERGKRAKAANELAMVASEMIPRLGRATQRVAELQKRVDDLETKGRDFRADLGTAIDVLVHDRSRERAHLDELRARRAALTAAVNAAANIPVSNSNPPPSMADPRIYEIESLEEAERQGNVVVTDLSFQIESLQKQLDQRNEAHEQALVQATGTLEGSLSAFRRLTNEIARTIDDGIDMLAK